MEDRWEIGVWKISKHGIENVGERVLDGKCWGETQASMGGELGTCK